MALNPKFAAQRLLFGQPAASGAQGVPPAVHTLELFLDYVCPFSAKQFKTFYQTVVPMIKANPRWASGLQVILRQQVQPWHPSSTLVHEAAVAVLQAAPDRYWAFSDALFADQGRYFDEAVAREPRNDTYRRLAKLGASVGVDEAAIYDRLAVPDAVPEGGHANGGNKVTDDLKLQIRYGRLLGIHVSPTAVFNGVVANDVSSSWTKEQWEEWLKKNIG
ncbi:thioredoxin-like protein [Hypoxylon sp. FL1284]|nr:thioredoxin-like protein [Hypoxylon sp. FL1284]